MIKTLLVTAVSTLLLSVAVVAQEANTPAEPMNMRYGNPPVMPMYQGGHYPAPPMNPQMMQQMRAQQQKKMQEMHEQRQAAADAKKQAAMEQLSEKQAQQHDGHMAQIEKSLANIEKLMQEMIDLMKSRY